MGAQISAIEDWAGGGRGREGGGGRGEGGGGRGEGGGGGGGLAEKIPQFSNLILTNIHAVPHLFPRC